MVVVDVAEPAAATVTSDARAGRGRAAPPFSGLRAPPCDDGSMLAVIGNLFAVTVATALFTTTLRLTKKRSPQ